MRAHALCLLLVSALTAQEPKDDPFGHSRHGGEFDEGPRQAAYLMPGMSEQVHFPVVGLGEAAQRFFDQGVCQQHGFWYFEAERSFRQVAKLQPECAMAYWGMAMANVEQWQRAAGFASQAVQRAVDLPEREKLYVLAIAELYQIDETLRCELQSGDAEKVKKAHAAVIAKSERDEKKLQRQFVRGLEAVVAACPDDIEAKALLAIQSWRNTEHDIPISSHGAVDALLDLVFTKAPLHPAHHYRIHLWDREKAVRALRSAAKNGSTAPGIAHQWHMSGHIYAKLDRHAEAAWQQEASGRVDHAHMMRDRVMPFLIHNYGHNQEWLARSLSYQGRALEALAVAKNLAELPRHPKFNQLDDDSDIAGYARVRLVTLCEEHELWREALDLRDHGFLEPCEHAGTEAARLGLLARALFRLGRLAEAEQVVLQVPALLSKARAQRAAAVDKAEDEALAKKQNREKVDKAIADAGRERTDGVRAVLDLQRELRAEQLLAAGDAKAALAEFEAIEDLPKTLLADAFVAAGEAQKAIELLEKEVKERPHRLATAGRLFLAYVAADKPEPKDRLRELMLDLPGTVDGQAPKTPFAARLGMGWSLCGERGLAVQRAEAAGFGDDFGPRPDLASLGPAHWSPVANPGFALPVASAGDAGQASQRKLLLDENGLMMETAGLDSTLPSQRPRLIVFYLGFGCLHCVRQLRALQPKAKAFADAGIHVIAIGTDTTQKAKESLLALPESERFTFPLLADPELAAFKAWHCYDDFEAMPLHGTFLIDAGGKVRWADISFEPFTEIEWLLGESKRLLALPAMAGSGSK